MSDAGKPLAPFIRRDLTRGEVDRRWANVRARLPRRGRFAWGSRAYAAVGLAAALAVALFFVLRGPLRARREPALEGATFASARDGQLITTRDGSQILLAEGAVVRVTAARDDRVAVTIDEGDVTFDVVHVDGRSWIVSAGDYDVTVVGTRFTVRAHGSGDVAVEVERGRVEVVKRAQPGATRATIGAGERWERSAQAAPAASSAAVASTAPAVEEAAPAPSASAAPAASDARPSWEELARAKRYKEAYDALGAAGFAGACDTANAERLLRLAEVARAAGKLADAERAFDLLRTRFRGDARAGLAAFELGRLRQDSLGKGSAAAEAFADAMALAPGAPFREDAEARRVRALEASGATAACIAARDAYLARYPSGAHAGAMRERCASR